MRKDLFSRQGLLASLVLPAALSACTPSATTRQAYSLPAPAPKKEQPLSIEKIIARAPELSLKRKTRDVLLANYTYIPEEKGKPASYILDNMFQSVDPENSALRYVKTEEGFSLVEIRKRKGVEHTPCPVYLPKSNCLMEHDMMIAFVVDCADRCNYLVQIFDYHEPIPLLKDNPSLNSVMRFFHGYETKVIFEIMFVDEGVIEMDDQKWAAYLEDKMDLIEERVRKASEFFEIVARRTPQ